LERPGCAVVKKRNTDAFLVTKGRGYGQAEGLLR
jgi:hypothetical protein